MSKENKVSPKDARLFQVGLDLARFYSLTQPVDGQPGTLADQEAQINGTMAQVFEALIGQIDTGKEDMRALFRITRKSRALHKRETGA